MNRVEFLMNVVFFRGFIALVSLLVLNSHHAGIAMAQEASADALEAAHSLTVAEPGKEVDDLGSVVDDLPILKDGGDETTDSVDKTSDTPDDGTGVIYTMSADEQPQQQEASMDSLGDIVQTMDAAAGNVDGMFFSFADGGSIMNGLLGNNEQSATSTENLDLLYITPAVTGAFQQMMQNAQNLPITLPTLP